MNGNSYNPYDPKVEDILKNLNKKKEISKKRKNSSRKGKRGEQKICNFLKKKFNRNFSRVPSSGAISTISNLEISAHKTLAGDIICPDYFKFCIENKAGYDIDLINIFCENSDYFHGKTSDKKQIIEFINQGSKSAIKSNLIPMIIYSKDYRIPITIIPIDDKKTNLLAKKIDILFPSYLILSYSNKNIPWEKWAIIGLEVLINSLPMSFFFEEKTD